MKLDIATINTTKLNQKPQHRTTVGKFNILCHETTDFQPNSNVSMQYCKDNIKQAHNQNNAQNSRVSGYAKTYNGRQSYNPSLRTFF